MSTPPLHLLSVDDLSDVFIERVSARADQLADGERPDPARGAGRSVALLFLASSLRTRFGFSAAAVDLGLTPLPLDELRWEEGMTQAESFADTLRVVGGLTDAIVARTPFELDRRIVAADCPVPFVNGGDGWNQHPSQALVDLCAIRRFRGEPQDLRIGIVGDLSMHVSRSLLQLLERTPPAALRLIAPSMRDEPGIERGGPLASVTERTTSWDTDGLDVVYLAGLPEGEGDHHLDASERAAYALTAERAEALDSEAIVLCPLPRIDEITDEARDHRSVRIFEQSDLGRAVRTALLELILEPALR